MSIKANLVAKHFNQAAESYEQAARVQRKMALNLAHLIKQTGMKFANVLEIGCGTGYLTRIILGLFPDIKLLATDISPQMLEICKSNLQKRGLYQTRNIEFILQDGENLKLPEKYDLVVSNACFQWFTDLPSALKGIHSHLKNEGFLLFSTFGPRTFWEMHDSFQTAYRLAGLPETAPRHGPTFFNVIDLRHYMIKAGFSALQISNQIVKTKYKDVPEFLTALKKMGARSAGPHAKFPLKRRILAEMIAQYEQKYGSKNGIHCTYDTILMKGRKTDASF